MRISTIKRIASEQMKIGESRLWIDTNSMDEIADAATRSDVAVLIRRHVIQERPKKGNSGYRRKKRINQLSKERRRGPGSVKGTKYARFPRKRRWVKTIRPLREELRQTLKEGKIDSKAYRKLYRFIKGGTIKSRAQLQTHIKSSGLGGEKQ